MQRIAVYLFCALAVGTAVWLVWPSRELEPEQAAQPGVASQSAGGHPVAGSSGSPSGSPAAPGPGVPGAIAAASPGGANAGAGAGAGDTPARRIAVPAADAESLEARADSAAVASSERAGDDPSDADSEGADSDSAAPPPLPAVAGLAPSTPDAGGADPADLVSDPNLPPLPPGAEDTEGVDRGRLTPREIWERVQEQCLDCTQEQREALYRDIDTKTGLAEGWTHPTN